MYVREYQYTTYIAPNSVRDYWVSAHHLCLFKLDNNVQPPPVTCARLSSTTIVSIRTWPAHQKCPSLICNSYYKAKSIHSWWVSAMIRLHLNSFLIIEGCWRTKDKRMLCKLRKWAGVKVHHNQKTSLSPQSIDWYQLGPSDTSQNKTII